MPSPETITHSVNRHLELVADGEAFDEDAKITSMRAFRSPSDVKSV